MSKEKRTIVCLCGSTRFMQAFQEANLRETLAGNIVLTIGCNTKSDTDLALNEQTKVELDALHKDKIDLADEVLILNVGGYVGKSTASEILHACKQQKTIRWLQETIGDEYCWMHRPGGWTCELCRIEEIVQRFFGDDAEVG